MDRRAFVRLAGGALVAAVPAACERTSSSDERLAAADTDRQPVATTGEFELDEATMASLQEGLSTGRWTARRLAEMYLARIDAMDRRGPALHAIIETNPDALAIADALDEERKSKGARGPLHGIPVLLKDNIDTADRMTTTAGSLAMAGSIPPRDAFLVQRLREAGAVILGKTNLSEWANFRSTRSTSGWSARGGQCRNPYALDRNPCGSSSGSGAAIAASFGAVAVGTETDGSIICPSSANGIVGIKPTLGLVSRSGIIPVAHSQDTAGPMTRTVADAALLLAALAGVDPADAATRGHEAQAKREYTASLDPKGLRGARIGVARKFFGFNRGVDAVMAAALDVMKQQGAHLVDPADLPSHGQYDESEMEVLLFEFKTDLNRYLETLGAAAPVKSLSEIIAFNEQYASAEMPHFGQELFLRAQAKGPLSSQKYLDALGRNHRLARVEGIDAALTRHGLDAIVAPSGGPAWLTDLVNGDHFTGGSSTPAAVAGYPSITVPAGYVRGLPVGLSLFGRAWSEPTLIRIAYAFEQATEHRRPPTFALTVDLTSH